MPIYARQPLEDGSQEPSPLQNENERQVTLLEAQQEGIPTFIPV